MENIHRHSSFFLLTLCAGIILLSFSAHAAEISNVVVKEVEDSSATIEWSTDVNTDATVHYGLDPSMGVVRYPLFDRKEHSFLLEDLLPSTTYHFRVLSADTSGNKAATAGFTFTTKSALSTPVQTNDAAQGALAEEIIEKLDQLSDPAAVQAVAEKLQQVAQDVLDPPIILGAPKLSIGSDTVEVSWTTDRESNSMVFLVPEDNYIAGSIDPYTIAQGNPNDATKNHTVEVIGLEPSTTYHFKISSEDSAGLVGETADDTFTTKSLLPGVRNPRITRVQETSATIIWGTGGVQAKGLVEYTNSRTKETKSAGSPVFNTQHSVRLSELEFGTRYSVVIVSTNRAGDEVRSDPLTFVTVRDRVAPEITKVNNESTIFPGEEVRIQTIIAWETDEPAVCTVFYTQGVAQEGVREGQSLQEEKNPVTTHTQVVVGFAPGTVYQFWMRCKDEAQNEVRSEDFVLITPVKEKSIIDIILENFEGTFGWVKNITN